MSGYQRNIIGDATSESGEPSNSANKGPVEKTAVESDKISVCCLTTQDLQAKLAQRRVKLDAAGLQKEDRVLRSLANCFHQHVPKKYVLKSSKKTFVNLDSKRKLEEDDPCICENTKKKLRLTLRKERDQFREDLIDAIEYGKCTKKEIMLLGRRKYTNIETTLITEEEMNLLRYYYYILNEIDDADVTYLQEDQIIGTLERIPEILREKYADLLLNSVQEMKKEYKKSMKKALVDFVLSDGEDPSNISKPILRKSKERDEIMNFGEKHISKFEKYRKKLGRSLILYHPCMYKTWEYWQCEFSHRRLIDIQKLITTGQALELNVFLKLIRKMVKSTKNLLTKKWIPFVQTLLEKAKRKKHLPDEEDLIENQRFFNCLAYIMESQLSSLCSMSTKDYIDYLLDLGSKGSRKQRVSTNCGFVISVAIKNKRITFEPSFQTFSDELSMILGTLYEAMSKYPRAEVQFYENRFDFGQLLKVKLWLENERIDTEQLMERYSRVISELILEHSIGPELQLHHFDKYNNFINEKDVESTLKMLRMEPPPGFEACRKMVIKYDDLCREIPVEFERTFVTGFFEVHRTSLIDYLTMIACYLKQQLLNGLIKDYQARAKAVGEVYQHMKDRALSVPENTAELMELRKFIHISKTRTILDQESALRIIMKHHSMEDIFKKHLEIVASKTNEYQAELKVKIKKFKDLLALYSKYCDEIQYWGTLDEIYRYRKKAANLENKLIAAMETIEQINIEEEMFGWEPSRYPLRKQISDKLSPYKKLYDASCDFLTSHKNWMESKIGSYDPEEIETETALAYRSIMKLDKILQEPIVRKLLETVKSIIDDFKDHMPVIASLGNPSLKDRHWELVSEVVGFPIKVDETTTLAKILDYGLDDYVAKLDSITEAATKEGNLEKALERMHADWEEIEFTVLVYRDTGTFVVSSVDDIQLLLDDHLTKAQTMKNSLYIKPFEKDTLEWEGKLVHLQDIMDYWLKVQATWMYLEPIFSSPDIQQQMPEEGRRFSSVDKIWREIMISVFADPRVMSVLAVDKMLERLKRCTSLLDLVQKGLTAYLEKKRLYFPRFFFLSNDELLEILSETKDPTRVQPHLKKCFEGIAKLNFTENMEATMMLSSEGEIVKLENIIDTEKARGQVEKWLLELETSMKKSIKFQYNVKSLTCMRLKLAATSQPPVGK